MLAKRDHTVGGDGTAHDLFQSHEQGSRGEPLTLFGVVAQFKMIQEELEDDGRLFKLAVV